MPAVTSCEDDSFVNQYRSRIEFYFCPQFLIGYDADAISGKLPKTDYATGNVPARSIVLVVPPRQQGTPVVVLDQQVHIDQRRDAADEEKQFLRPAVALRPQLALELANRVRDERWPVSQN